MDKYGIKIKGILKCEDEFLIVKRWYDDRIEDPYQWEFLDTDMMDGETPDTACLRYIQESTGIYTGIDNFAYSWTYRLGDNKYLGIAFICKVDDELVFLSEDLHEHKWVKAEDLGKYITNKRMLDDMKQAGVI